MLGFSLISGIASSIIEECKRLVYAILFIKGPLFDGGNENGKSKERFTRSSP